MIIRPEAESDLANARDWYEKQREGLGGEFLQCVEEALDRIVQAPQSHPIIYRRVRRARVRRFPFLVYYRLESDELTVLGVLHGSRDPRIWRSRSS